ncbi:anti-sigma factor family protein [Nonomuraea sp. PA05]|uniref:anti-sigma factor family protein n=1 Tax=Nonomuraea sp. PA05 TaxID=2604466 RepID=UPI0021CC5505|nr:zf-HC2 domain-containing protein [Nonomuraea sp. PA05]
MTCEEVRISLGAHALGALEPEEELEIDHHLATCEACGAELMELEGVGAFLGKVSERDVELVASPPRQVLDRLLNDRVKRTRRGRAVMSLIAAAAVLVVGGTVWTTIQTGSGGETTAAQAPAPAASEAPQVLSDQSSDQSSEEGYAQKAQPRDAASDSRGAGEASQSPAAPESATRATPVPTAADEVAFSDENEDAEYYATVLVRPTAAGSALGVQVTGVPVGTDCLVVVVGVDGREERSQSWIVKQRDYETGKIFRFGTTMSLGEIARFEVVDTAGKLLVNVPVKDRGK